MLQKNLKKEVFLGSTWNHSASKSVDTAEITKKYLIRQSCVLNVRPSTNFNGFSSPQAKLKYIKLIKEVPRELSQRFID